MFETLLINPKKGVKRVKHSKRVKKHYVRRAVRSSLFRSIAYAAGGILVGGLITKAVAQTSVGQKYPWIGPAGLTLGVAFLGKNLLKQAYVPVTIGLGATAITSAVMSTPALSGVFSDMCGQCGQGQLNDYMMNQLNGYRTGNLQIVS